MTEIGPPPPPPPQPPDIVIWLANQWITGHDIDSRQTGTDTSDTWIIFRPISGKPREARLESVEVYINFRPDYHSSLRLTERAQELVADYLRWERRNKRDLAEFNRLKKKFNM
jgi:hypothetical protein